MSKKVKFWEKNEWTTEKKNSTDQIQINKYLSGRFSCFGFPIYLSVNFSSDFSLGKGKRAVVAVWGGVANSVPFFFWDGGGAG